MTDVPAYVAALQAVGLSDGTVPIYVPTDPSLVGGGVIQIGYWTKDSNLCAAVVQIYNQYIGVNNQSVYPPSEWLTNNDWGLVTPVSAYCFSKGQKPSWSVANPDGSVSVASDVSGRTPIVYTQDASGTFNTASTDATYLTNNPVSDLTAAAQPVLTDIQNAVDSAASALSPASWFGGLTTGTVLIGGSLLALVLVMRRRA